MTSRPVSAGASPLPPASPSGGPTTTTTTTSVPVPVAGPGGRPHLPPVAADTTSRRSARKAPLAWLPWLLLGLLALTLLVVALLAKAAGGGDAAARPSATGGEPQRVAQGIGDATAALSAGGTDLLRLDGRRLSDLEGQRASGTARVESVVADEGFWVGSDASRRVFVFLAPEARRSAGESGFRVRTGQTVSLEGTVKASSAQFTEAAGVTDAEGSRQLVDQGGYVEATEVRLAA